MKYCSNCGSEVEYKIPATDNRERACCPACNTVHYVNPKIVVGTIPVWQDKILLCKRAIEPRHGYWTLPAGFMELHETTHAGALRETWEEAQARVELGPLFTCLDVLRAEQVHLFYRATLLEPTFGAGPESLEVGLFGEAEIPWDELAFKTVSTTLTRFFEDRQAGFYGLHTGDVFEPTHWTPSHFKG
ncbi:MAG: NUDIX hydrolase [Limnobacter sp.]|nr:NUDIX hydrolase [Limnobacter sp.]